MKSGNFIKKELSSIPLQIIPSYIPDKNFMDENIIPFERDESLIFKNNKLNNFAHSIGNIEIKKNNLVIQQENDWKLLNEDLKEKINNFLKEITYQDSSIMLNYEDETYNLFQIVIKKDLVNFFNNNISQYFEEICSNYNHQNSKFVNNGGGALVLSSLHNNDKINEFNEFNDSFDNYKEKNNKNSNDSDKIIRIENKNNLKEKIKSSSSSEKEEPKLFGNNLQAFNEDKNNDFIKEICLENIYQNIQLINNYEKNEIEEIIKNEDIVLYFKNDINKTLENDSTKKNLKYLEKITLIVEGKKGAGKSTLINCLLKEYLAKEGEYSVTTLRTDTYTSKSIPFLSLVDTRGYELNEEYNPDEIKKEVLKTIKSRRELKDYNNYIQCILFCIDGESDIDEFEKKSLKELINNEYNVPLIIVFTNATEKDRVKRMEREFKNLFPNNAFIPVLGRKNEFMEQYGLDELLNTILKCLESVEKGDFFDLIKDEYLEKEKARLIEMIPEIKKKLFLN